MKLENIAKTPLGYGKLCVIQDRRRRELRMKRVGYGYKRLNHEYYRRKERLHHGKQTVRIRQG